MARKLIVEIVGDSRSYERALRNSSTATSAFGAQVTKTTQASQALRGALSVSGGRAGFLFGSAAFVGAASATQLISSTTSAASDLNEQLSRTEVIQGKSADAMIEWSKTTAQSMGISQRAALASAATFSGLFQTVGVDTDQAGELSRSLVQLAADLASLQNSSPEEALLALRSGLAGEAEPLRRFNIFLTEARVQQQALAETGKTTTAALTQQEKTLARYNLILKDSAPAQGNFADTSKGLANQQRILAAQVDDLSTKVGTVLVPALTALVGGLNDAAVAGGELFGVLGKLAEISGIEIPIKLIFSGGRGGHITQDILRHVILGPVSPLALGLSIGKEIADGIRGGVADATTEPGSGRHDAGRAAAIAAGRQAAAAPAAAAAAIARATNRANATLNQQIRDSATRIAHLKDLIRADPTNAKLQQRLTAEIKKQNGLLEQQKSLNEANAATAKSAAEAAHDASVQATADAREAARAAAELRQEQVKRQQFQALGLTPEGLKPTPGSGALLRRALGLEKQVKGTVLDTPKVNAQLKKIVAFLRKNFGKAGRDVREAILGMLNEISDAFEGKSGGGGKGPLTATHGLRASKIVEGLGLSPQEERELRARLSHFNTGGRALGGGATSAPGGSRPPMHDRDTSRIVVDSFVTINVDGHKLVNVVTRGQQKDRRRNPRQKRGQHRK